MKIVVLELFDLPPAAGFCRELRYSDDPEWVLVGGDFGFHHGIVGPVTPFTSCISSWPFASITAKSGV